MFRVAIRTQELLRRAYVLRATVAAATPLMQVACNSSFQMHVACGSHWCSNPRAPQLAGSRARRAERKFTLPGHLVDLWSPSPTECSEVCISCSSREKEIKLPKPRFREPGFSHFWWEQLIGTAPLPEMQTWSWTVWAVPSLSGYPQLHTSLTPTFLQAICVYRMDVGRCRQAWECCSTSGHRQCWMVVGHAMLWCHQTECIGSDWKPQMVFTEAICLEARLGLSATLGH